MEKKEIRDRATSLGLSKSFKEVVALPGISRFHCIEPQINGFVQSKMYSTQSMVEKEAAPLVFPFDLEESGRESDGSDMSLVEVENDRDHDDISSSDPSAEMIAIPILSMRSVILVMKMRKKNVQMMVRRNHLAV